MPQDQYTIEQLQKRYSRLLRLLTIESAFTVSEWCKMIQAYRSARDGYPPTPNWSPYDTITIEVTMDVRISRRNTLYEEWKAARSE
jgi:hypothetical protein